MRRELARWRSPTFEMLFPVDFAIVLVLVMLLAPGALQVYHGAAFRARLTEALNLGAHARYTVVEQFALSGAPFEASGAATAITLPSPAAHLAGAVSAKEPRRAESALKKRARQIEAGESNTLSRYVSTLHVEGAAIVLGGRIGDAPGGDYELALVPAVLDGGVPQVVVWQCGRNQLPDGWTGPTPELTHRVPEALLPSPCRSRRTDR